MNLLGTLNFFHYLSMHLGLKNSCHEILPLIHQWMFQEISWKERLSSPYAYCPYCFGMFWILFVFHVLSTMIKSFDYQVFTPNSNISLLYDKKHFKVFVWTPLFHGWVPNGKHSTHKVAYIIIIYTPAVWTAVMQQTSLVPA